MKNSIAAILLCIVALTLSAAELKRFVPSSTTTIVATTTRVYFINLANNTSSTVTVTITDGSTSCNGGACPILPAVDVAAHTKFAANLNGEIAEGGIYWSATTANAVAGWISYSRCNFTCAE